MISKYSPLYTIGTWQGFRWVLEQCSSIYICPKVGYVQLAREFLALVKKFPR